MTWPGLGGTVLILLGLVLLTAGAAILLARRFPRRSGGPRLASDTPPSRTRFSVSTRLAFAVLLLIAGYHCVAWAFPPSRLPLQLPREWWWAWGLGLVAFAAIALAGNALDRRGHG